MATIDCLGGGQKLEKVRIRVGRLKNIERERVDETTRNKGRENMRQ